MDNSLDMSSGKHLSHCKVTLMQGGMFFFQVKSAKRAYTGKGKS